MESLIHVMDLRMILSTAFKDGQPCHAGSAKLQTTRQAMRAAVLPSQEEEDKEELPNNEAIISGLEDDGKYCSLLIWSNLMY